MKRGKLAGKIADAMLKLGEQRDHIGRMSGTHVLSDMGGN